MITALRSEIARETCSFLALLADFSVRLAGDESWGTSGAPSSDLIIRRKC